MMKKITCPYCSKTQEINDEENILYCVECSKPFNVAQGARLYSMMLLKYLNNGRDELYYSTRYDKSIEAYNKVLEMDETNVEGITGLIMANLYNSKVRDMHLDECFSLLVKYENELSCKDKKEYEIDILVDFFSKFTAKLNYFHENLLNLLADENSKFYEKSGLEIYTNFISNYIKILRQLSEIYKGEKDFYERLEIDENSLKEKIKDLIILGKNNYEIYDSNPPYMLNNADPKVVIQDNIFKDNTKLYKNRNIALILALIFFVILVVGIILMVTIRDKLAIGVAVGGVGLVGFAAALIVNTILKRKLFKE